MRWVALVLVAACGGKSAPAGEHSIANSVPPRTPSQICEDTVVNHRPRFEMGLVISETAFLERAIRQHRAGLRACYEQRLKYKPHLGGKVLVELTIGGDGKATRIHTRGFDEELDRCLCEKLSEIQFETLSGAEVKVTYPLLFTAST
ncbi:MAG: AgmX/PglI C-terminal domain-containing protein [Kofleriaceae bacterium]